MYEQFNNWIIVLDNIQNYNFKCRGLEQALFKVTVRYMKVLMPAQKGCDTVFLLF